MESTLKGKNLLLKEQILSLRVDSILVGFLCPEMQTGSHESRFPLKNGGKNMEVNLRVNKV